MFLHVAVDVAHAFLLQNFVDGDEDACFLYIAELVVDGCAEHAHGGAEPHVGIHEGRDVEAQVAHFGVERAIVGLEVIVYEECFELFAWGVGQKFLFLHLITKSVR